MVYRNKMYVKNAHRYELRCLASRRRLSLSGRMKKALSLILLMVYFVVSTGFTVNLHYCMDRFHSWELGAAEQDACATCGMKTGDSDGCCRDELKTVKLQQDLVQAKYAVAGFSLPALVATVPEHIAAPFQNATQVPIPCDTGPPLISEQDTYLENCVFRL